jgi:putative heme-binding domain-containing protein
MKRNEGTFSAVAEHSWTFWNTISRDCHIRWIGESVEYGAVCLRLTKNVGFVGTLAATALFLTARGPAVHAASPQAAAHSANAVTNPLTGNAAAIQEGNSLFRGNCSVCHGMNGHGGGRGPDLTSGRWTHGSSDAEIFRTIAQGVPGTQMPANGFEDSETWAIIAYLRTLTPGTQKKAATHGDTANGEKIFTTTGHCSTCHMVKGCGGLLGPDLSRVGAARSIDYLIESIREPDKELSDGMLDPNNHYGLPLVYDTVTVVLKNGGKVVGVAKNEDTFSVQLLDTNQQLHLFLTSDVKDVVHERKSLMPAYSEQAIPAAQLQDLLAYLESLRGE